MAENQMAERTGSCVICRLRDPDEFDTPVCSGCRGWLAAAIYSIGGFYPQLPNMLEPAVTAEPRVSGTRGKPAPVNLDVHDLLGAVVRDGGRPIEVTGDNWVQQTVAVPIRTWVWDGYDTNWTPRTRDLSLLERRPVRDEHGRPVAAPAQDQVGYVPIAQVLDSWARDWVTERNLREHRPDPTVASLVGWLANRVTWACDHYPHIDDFATSIRSLRGALMGVLGEFDPEPQYCDGVICKRCDRKSLFARQDGSGDVDCTNDDCRKVYGRDEYADWIKHNGAFERSRRTPQEVRNLLKPSYRRPSDTESSIA